MGGMEPKVLLPSKGFKGKFKAFLAMCGDSDFSNMPAMEWIHIAKKRLVVEGA